jgi:hypothetical protein
METLLAPNNRFGAPFFFVNRNGIHNQQQYGVSSKAEEKTRLGQRPFTSIKIDVSFFHEFLQARFWDLIPTENRCEK